jgi:hypothetical protein
MPQSYQPFYSIQNATADTIGAPADIGASTEDMAMQIVISGAATVTIEASQNNQDWTNVSIPPGGWTASTIVMLDRRVAFYRARATGVVGEVDAIIGYGRGRHGELLNAGPTETPAGFAIGQIDVSGFVPSTHQFTASLPLRVNGGASADMTVDPTAFSFLTTGSTVDGIVAYDALTGGYKVQPATVDDSGNTDVTSLNSSGQILSDTEITTLGTLRLHVTGVTLVNGLNDNVAVGSPRATLLAISGPAAPYSIGGFMADLDGHADIVIAYDTTGQPLTFVDESGTSAGSNRIHMDSGADVTAQVGMFVYDTTTSRYRLVASGGTGYVALQGTAPGTAQTGNANISGNFYAARLLATVTGAFSAVLGTATSSGGIGVAGVGGDNAGIEGNATTGAGVRGLATGAAGIGVAGGSAASISGWFQSTSNGNTQPTLVAQQQGAATAPLIVAQDNAGAANFRVGSDGDLSMIKSVVLAWPAANAAGSLTNDGAGNLSWAAVGVSDGDKGDITVSVGGTVWTIDAAAVSYSKIQDVSAASKLLGRGSAGGAGDVEEITLGAGLTMTATTLSAAGVTDATYVTTSAHAGLSAEKVLPYLGNYNPDVPPASPSGTDDEFDDDSISGSWTVIGTPDTANETTFHGYFYLQDNDAAETGYYIAYTPGAAALTVAVKIKYDLSLAANSYCGLVLTDSSDTSLAVMTLQHSNGGNFIQARYGASGGSTLALNGDLYNFPYLGTGYLALQRDSGTNYTATFSKDGFLWHTAGTWSQAGTIARARLIVNGQGGTNTTAAFDFIRMFTSQTTIIGATP